MKILLATTMALGVVLMLGANQPTNATVTQPAVSAYHQNHVTQAQWPYRYHRNYDYYYGPRRGFGMHFGW